MTTYYNTSFTELMDQYKIDEFATTVIETMLPEGSEFHQCMLHCFLGTCFLKADFREAAKILAKYLCQYDYDTVHDRTRTMLKSSGLKRNSKYGIGYPHADGTYHFFPTEDVVREEPAEENPSISAILNTFDGFDWTYAMSDDGRVWQRGEAAYKALVQQCKDAGLTEQQARDLQEKYWLKKGYTKPFYCMARIKY